MTRILQIARINHDKRVQYGDIKNVTRGTRPSKNFVRSGCACTLLGNKVMRVLQNLSNLKVGHFFKKCLFRSGVKSAFIPGAPGELLEDLTP